MSQQAIFIECLQAYCKNPYKSSKWILEKYPSLSQEAVDQLFIDICKKWIEIDDYYMNHARVTSRMLSMDLLISIRIADVYLENKRHTMKKGCGRIYQSKFSQRLDRRIAEKEDKNFEVRKRKSPSENQAENDEETDLDEGDEQTAISPGLSLADTQYIPPMTPILSASPAPGNVPEIPSPPLVSSGQNFFEIPLLNQLFAPALFQHLATAGLEASFRFPGLGFPGLGDMSGNRIISIPLNNLMILNGQYYIQYQHLLQLLR